MFKIGDFSKMSRVSVKTLRYYDEIGLLNPVRVDELSGYRYYSADQLPRLNRIVGLKNLGLSLDEIGRILTDNPSTEKTIELLRMKQQETLSRLREERDRLKRVEEWLRTVEKEGAIPAYDVITKRVEAQKVASLRKIIPAYGDVSQLYEELFAYLGRKRVKLSGPPMVILHDMEFREKDADVEAAIPVAGNIQGHDQIQMQELPAVEQMACVVHKGPYENIGQAYRALMTWIEINGYHINGADREIFLKSPGQIIKGNPRDYVTEVQLPVKKADGKDLSG
jgi:DNA-binding transcriptional MerR regulator